MDRIEKIEDIQVRISSIKGLKKGFVTNFFLDIPKHTLWIKSGKLYVWDSKECVFFFFQDDGFYHLFFISINEAAIRNAYFEMEWDGTALVIDILGRPDSINLHLWQELGFIKHSSLQRMMKLGDVISSPVDDAVQKAGLQDLTALEKLLKANFDPLSEQLPMKEELEQMIINGTVILYRLDEKIVGLILYERNGQTLYLRYWLVLPGYRNLHIGSKLFSAFMNAGVGTKRQLLWVMSSNENAMKRYAHYGFKPDGLVDYVLKNGYYERKNY